MNVLKRFAKLILQKKYPDQDNPQSLQSQLTAVKSMPRYIPSSIEVFGKQIKFVDSASFLSIYNEVIKREIYKFKADSDAPLIIDCGANIGLSVIYFKTLYPKSRIIAFEPDPNVYKVLIHNIETFNLTDVICHNKGLWNNESVIEFYSEGADAGRIAQSGDTTNITSIDTVRLSPYLSDKVALLKIDIEGAETAVLKECVNELINVNNIFVEYHSFTGETQTIDELINVLTTSGFRLYITAPDNTLDQPFLERNDYHGMDMQINIFAFR